MKFAFAVLFVIAALAACKKSDLTSKPVLKFKNNDYTKDLRLNAVTKIELEATDLEGDLADTFYLIKKITNRNRPQRVVLNTDALPAFPATQKVGLLVQLINARFEPPGEPMLAVGSISASSDADTCVFVMSVVDRKGNKSDSITTEQFILRRN
jgi:hypothetical protein